MDADGDGRVGRHEFCSFFISNSELLPWFGFGVDDVVVVGGDDEDPSRSLDAEAAERLEGQLLSSRSTVGSAAMVKQLQEMSQKEDLPTVPVVKPTIGNGCCSLS
jgi:hypothetical protein